ncbi:glycosyltransferase family 4 protein [Sinomonas halotolerans]|uniref:D-inositol 3-phosphate glycosyltransferase n=1 Tax=Sinomonas halotolerans TaxID=1644133 RepID=A0ABU9X1H5_9MICC
MTTTTTRLLIVGLNYAPEPTGNAPYTTGLAEALAERRFTVEVISGYPHYPAWKVFSGFSGLATSERLGGVGLRRLRHYVPRSPRLATRLLMELTFGLHSVLRGWRRPDVVLVVSPALFSAAVAIGKARLLGRPVGIWVQDLYSRGLEETSGGSSLATRAMKRLESLIFRSASGVSVIHDRFREYVVDELNVAPDKVSVIRNWTHIEHHAKFDRDAVRARLGWLPDEVIVLHAGNMGVKQGLENVVQAAKRADASGSNVRFVLVGDGNQRPKLEALGGGVLSLEFIGSLSAREYSEVLRAADVLLINELAELREMSVPSKLTSYFSAERPVVAATHFDSATADEIRASGAGVQVEPGNPTALLKVCELIGTDAERARRLANAGRPYAEAVLSADAAVAAYASWLTKLAQRV